MTIETITADSISVITSINQLTCKMRRRNNSMTVTMIRWRATTIKQGSRTIVRRDRWKATGATLKMTIKSGRTMMTRADCKYGIIIIQ